MEDNNITSLLKPSAEAGFNDDKYSGLNPCHSDVFCVFPTLEPKLSTLPRWM